MRIIHITDLHLGRAGDQPNGIDVRQNFQQVLAAASAIEPDLLVLTGDLCLEVGERDTYAFIKTALDASQLPYALLAGNHDDSPLLMEVFGLKPGPDGEHLYYEISNSPLPIFCLDTAAYEISRSQLAWLAKALDQLNGEPVVLFIHHPPLLMGVPFMDNKYPLRNHAELSQLLLQYTGLCYVFCGHYHVDKSMHRDNLHVFVTPSCYFQIDWRENDFAVDHHRIAYRDILLSPDGVQQGLVWIE